MEQAVARRRIEGEQLGHAGAGQAALAALAEDARQQVFRAAEARLRQPDVAAAPAGRLHLLGAAGVVAHDPVHVAGQDRAPEELDVVPGADRRIHLGVSAGRRVDVEQQVPDGDLPLEAHVWKHARHRQRGLQRLARRQVQQVHVVALGLVGEVGGDPHRQALGVRWPCGAVGAQAGQGAVLRHQTRVGIEDVGELAVQAHADVRGEGRVRPLDATGLAQDELEVGEVVGVVGADHQEAPLLVLSRLTVQAIAAVEHEDLERGHALVRGQGLHLADVRGGDRSQVIGVVAMVAAVRLPEQLGKELGVGTAAVEVVLAGAEVGEHRRDAAAHRRPALAPCVLGQRPVDADVGVRVDDAGKAEPTARVVDLGSAGDRNRGGDQREASVLDAEVDRLHLGPPRADQPHVLDDEVERCRRVHARLL